MQDFKPGLLLRLLVCLLSLLYLLLLLLLHRCCQWRCTGCVTRCACCFLALVPPAAQAGIHTYKHSSMAGLITLQAKSRTHVDSFTGGQERSQAMTEAAEVTQRRTAQKPQKPPEYKQIEQANKHGLAKKGGHHGCRGHRAPHD